MCHSIIPFDVTDIGPLFVASFKNSNMIVADKATKTFFQQASFQSLIGKLHPTTLTMIPFQIMTWSDVKDTIKNPLVVHVTKKRFQRISITYPWNLEEADRHRSHTGTVFKEPRQDLPSKDSSHWHLGALI